MLKEFLKRFFINLGIIALVFSVILVLIMVCVFLPFYVFIRITEYVYFQTDNFTLSVLLISGQVLIYLALIKTVIDFFHKGENEIE